MKKLSVLLIVLFISLNTFSQQKLFWDEIKAFKTEDSINPPKDGMILFIGSSSFRLWKTAKEDLHNETIVNRAFGGATLEDLIYYQNDVVLKYNPKKIVIYCGENDVASSEKITGQIVFDRYKTLHTTLRKQFPKVPIIFVSLKPCILRWEMKDRMIAANDLIKDYLKQDKNAVFVNIWDKMLENGKPMNDIFIEDNLHMNAKGYAIWSKELLPLINN
ncbi:GDSL-type esterase/lipase family protein [Flavobacterium capsici]|uniref:GDSL-type esterase/lipase family protein n=1 Tax=Flavobacterium capsici TaxID=3075618 RepID=A0AA96JB50_9FLAO|nr:MULTISPECIES: GDSL-type esterase/lipase family protein [unclassified Flavobacterium]WNM18238.1 GDSL-type esterase/lipase family protein [Flavobacterium sp. PMR2A8]WNM22289.1 GDSL-type esterase/lipase family protein [Flavobacterium sp. PMTSA4]